MVRKLFRIWMAEFNQIYFLFKSPIFQLFFSSAGRSKIIKYFLIDKFDRSSFFSEIWPFAGVVGFDSFRKIGSSTNI